MGLFDLPAPLLAWIDQTILAALPPVARLVAWGLIGSVLSMALYKAISPQARIARLRDAALEARRRMTAYDGEFSGIGAVAFASLALSFRHVGVVLLPAVIASLPVLCLLVWLSNSYGHRLPDAGDTIAFAIQPTDAGAAWDVADDVTPNGFRHITWPAAGESVRLLDEHQRTLVELPFADAVPVIHKRQWWNRLIGNPIGYLPADGAVDRVTFGLSSNVFIAFGPTWLGGWEMIFISVLFIASIAIKLAFRIH